MTVEPLKMRVRRVCTRCHKIMIDAGHVVERYDDNGNKLLKPGRLCSRCYDLHALDEAVRLKKLVAIDIESDRDTFTLADGEGSCHVFEYDDG